MGGGQGETKVTAVKTIKKMEGQYTEAQFNRKYHDLRTLAPEFYTKKNALDTRLANGAKCESLSLIMYKFPQQ